MATPDKPGAKMMSSRLATMKFMQRANHSPPSTPGTPEEPSAKRQRLSNGSAVASPASTPTHQDRAVQAAQAREEQIRQAVLEREGTAKGDTRWYLSVQQTAMPAVDSPLRIVSAGYSALDAGSARKAEDEEEDTAAQPRIVPGRMNFGFSRKPMKTAGDGDKLSSASESDDDDEDEDEDESDDPSGAKALIRQAQREAGDRARAERKAQRKADAAESARLAELRRNKAVDLNRVTSISGTGAPSSKSNAAMECFKCGKNGHAKRDCPQLQQNGRKRKT
ncbi:hypothetical protein LTR95_001580 [Oleoguttula sp. CCFEE 5521]